MSGHGANPSFFDKKKIELPEHLLNLHPLRPIISHFCLTPTHLQSVRHMCITPYHRMILPYFSQEKIGF